MDSRQFIESGTLETYAMGLATEQEAKLVAEMAARYPEVKAELLAVEAAMENFDRQNAVEPPAHLKAKILSKVQNAPGSTMNAAGSSNGKSDAKVISIAPQKQSNFFKYAAGIALLLCVGSVWYSMSLRNTIAVQQDQLDNYLLSVNEAHRQAHYWDSTAQNLQHENENMIAELNLLKKPSMKSIELKGMDAAPDAKAMVYANTATGESYLEIMNLPAAPDGMQYQFWGMVDGKPVDAGMIPAEGSLAGIHPMKTVPNAAAYAISLEPKGGSQQPTGKIYVMGNS